MYGRRDELSADVLERAAREALTQSQSSAMWDYRLYDTHGCVMSWADRGDDILAESNYLCVLEHLQGVAVQDDGDAQETPDEYVLDVSVSHWLVGSLRQLFIQVYDDAGEFTETFKEAVCVVIALREDYPVFDEADYSEREYAAYSEQLREEVDFQERQYDDSTEESDAIRDRFYVLWEDYDCGACYADGVNTSEVEDIYRKARNAYYEERAQEYLDAMAQERTRQIDGQTSLL